MANGFGSTTQSVMKCPACQAEVHATLSIGTQVDTTRPKEAIATVSITGMQLSHDCVPEFKDERLAALEREARAAQGNRTATYERLQGTPRNSHWHPSLADPRTLADRRLADAQNALAQALKSDS